MKIPFAALYAHLGRNVTAKRKSCPKAAFLSSVIAGTADGIGVDGNLIALENLGDGFAQRADEFHISCPCGCSALRWWGGKSARCCWEYT
jgi:hypothetical protein